MMMTHGTAVDFSDNFRVFPVNTYIIRQQERITFLIWHDSQRNNNQYSSHIFKHYFIKTFGFFRAV